MKIESTREIDINKLINQLTTKATKVDPSAKPYEITVNKQLLIDAADVIRHFNSMMEDDGK